MTEVESSRETYGFRCGRCDHTWERVYEVRRWQEQSGDEFTCYRTNGMQAVSPQNAACPRCGGYRVRLLPVHPPSERITHESEDRAETPWYGWAVLSEVCHVPGTGHGHL
jgi:hypothetical protein